MLTFVYAYYRNPRMLAQQYALWADYPADFLRRASFVVVDDGSPEPAVSVPRPDLPLSLYRVTEDRPWHQDGARNLGAHVAGSGMIFFGDMDHAVPSETALRLLTLSDQSALYQFPRRFVSKGPKLSPAVNVFAVHRDTFWRAGGYDERFCGAYGSDSHFQLRLLKHARKTLLRDAWLDVYMPHDIADCRTEGLARTGAANAAKLAAAVRASEGKEPLTLAFPWERVA